MKFSAAAIVLGLAASVVAQEVCNSVAAQVPACATPCINAAASKVGCGPKEYECQCKSSAQAAIQSDAQSCVLSACGATAVQVLGSASAVCACAATAKPAGPTDAPAKTTGSYPMSTPPVESGDHTKTHSGAAHSTGHHHGTASSGSGVYPTSVSPSITPFKGDGVAVAGSMGGVMAGLLAVIAAL